MGSWGTLKEVWSRAYLAMLSDVKGVGGCAFDCEDEGGSKKGSAPDGEAWLLDGTSSTDTPAIRRKV